MNERTFPHNTDAERATLGAILLDREAIVPIAAWLLPEHFYREQHAWIYDAQLACYHRRVPPDLTTVADELRRRDRLEQVGGVPYLVDLSNAAPTAYHVEYYARIVERTAVLRRLIQAGGTIAALGYNDTDNVEQVLDAAEQELFRVSQRRAPGGFVPIGTVADEYASALDRAQAEPGLLAGLPTGFTDLDRCLGGLQRSDLLILAGRPGQGKTSFALGIAWNVAQQGATVGVVSLEMSRDQLLQRLIALHTGVDTQRLRLGRLHDDEYVPVVEAMGRISTLPLYIDDGLRGDGVSVAQLRAQVRRLQADHGLDLLIIDYLQLMDGSRPGKRQTTETEDVSYISKSLKALARELNIPVIALSQLSRAVEGRANRVPQLADLRQSGAIEQDADVVLFVYREELYDKDTDKKGIAEIHVAKHRNGPLDVINLVFDSRTTRFRDLAPYHTPVGY